jgi:hypothetical protein
MMWLAAGAGILAVWIGLGLFCAETLMGERGSRVRRPMRARFDRESHTPIPTPRVAD